MSSVLVWRPYKGNVGHVSLRVSPDLYISFWPKDPEVSLPIRVESTGRTYDEDCQLEGSENSDGTLIKRPPDEFIKVRCSLNEEKIRDWWKDYQYSGYDLVDKNCIDAVHLALGVGGCGFFKYALLGVQLDSIRTTLTANVLFGGKKKNSNN